MGKKLTIIQGKIHNCKVANKALLDISPFALSKEANDHADYKRSSMGDLQGIVGHTSCSSWTTMDPAKI